MAYTDFESISTYGTVSNWYYTLGSQTDPSSLELKPNTDFDLLFTHFNIGIHGIATPLFRNQQENIQAGVTLRLADANTDTLQQWTFPYMNSTSGFNANLETEILVRREHGFNIIVNSIYSGTNDMSIRVRARSVQVATGTLTPFNS